MDTRYQKSEIIMQILFQDGSSFNNKELEKLKFKYAAMKQNTEKNMDQIAELRIDIKDRDELVGQLEGELHSLKDATRIMDITVRKKDEEIAEWKYEANHRNIELARLKYENKQQEDRIKQLRKLLIQQSEVMHLHQSRDPNNCDIDEYEEHVSAV